jgi:ubiquinone/menaquinone biosynthesis C-methylase UbiE
MSTASAPVAPDLPPQAIMGRMISGYAVSQLIYVAARLQLLDHLEREPQTGAELAGSLGAQADSLTRVLRGLTVLGMVSVEDDGRYRVTPLGRLLLGSTPGSMRALTLGGEESYQAWTHLLHTVETGEPAFDYCFGASRFQYLAQHPEAAAAFNEAMSNMARMSAAAVTAAHNFSQYRRIVDVGGGTGILLLEILGANPTVHGVLVDTSQVIAAADKNLRDSGLAGRCELVAGDFFQSVPPGADAYLVAQTIHNWNDAHARRILQNCRDAMAVGGVVLVIEMIMPDRLDGSPMNYPLVMTDLQMMVITGGRERTLSEHRALYESAGLTLRNVTRTKSPFVILETVAS